MITDLTARLTRKSRSNFYYAFLTLPRPRREALYAVYAFCRTVDDIADLGGERAADPSARRRGLQRWREDVARCYEPGATPTHPIAMRLQAAVRAYTIPRAALEAIIDGVEMDLDRVAYETADDLYPYCYRVASAVGLACIEIFGYTDPRSEEHTSELQSHSDLVCRLLLEKKNKDQPADRAEARHVRGDHGGDARELAQLP